MAKKYDAIGLSWLRISAGKYELSQKYGHSVARMCDQDEGDDWLEKSDYPTFGKLPPQ